MFCQNLQRKNQSNTTEDLELQNNKQSKIIERLEQEIKRLEQEIKKVMNSNSYKYAEPLRKLRRIASSLINRLIN